ncbi:hypothetical protein IS481_04020 [Caldimonas thermodepolymerans]|jgi:hypothetical protein|nr:T6SS immunity protein Tli4 family protein [Caldimonas thermodepolymerans]QPC32349.1 hypothetical protein IS481_04020 [Caldimonas thermodepolymerans]UZG48899.1 T6SS immunity protein Tli4 family protein [Caldimonas thermodepolymerans]
MTMHRRNLIKSALALPLFPWSSGCSARIEAMSAEEARFVERLTARMRTRCVGRYLIDVPEEFVLNPVHRFTIGKSEIQVSTQPMDRAGFRGFLRTLQQRYEAQRLVATDEKFPFLSQVWPTAEGLIFNISESPATPTRARRNLEARWWDGGVAFCAEIKAFDGTYPELQDDSFYRRQGSDVPAKLEELRSVISRLRGRSEDEIPTEPGDCFPHGFFRGGPMRDVDVVANFHLQGTPDVYLFFKQTTSVWEDETMLQRSGSIMKWMVFAGMRTLRKGERVIHGQPYEEWLVREPADVTSARVPGHGLRLHGNETSHDPARPSIELYLYNGHYIPSPPKSLEEQAKTPFLKRATLSEAQVVALWDAITPTLRLRPGAF